MAARFWSILILLVATCISSLHAHPVAQGAMEVLVQPERVEITVRAANEEAFVSEAYGGPSSPGETLEDVWKRHGAYLLQHVSVSADGAALHGEVTGIQPSGNNTPAGRTDYHLAYNIPKEHHQPGLVQIRQDVLNELEFAPGNRWEATYVVKIAEVDQAGREGLLLTSREPIDYRCTWSSTPVSSSAPAPPKLDHRALVGAYLRHGVMHILTGYDHMLFMCALVLAVVSFLDLVKVVTAFTIAHTITLTLAVLDLVRLPSHIVEPMIAASIVFVALQNILWPKQSRGWSRLVVAFGFGLFHGLGFAGGLLEAMSGMPGLAIATAIVAFSLGVEFGHQMVVIPVYGGLQLARRANGTPATAESLRRHILRCGSAAVFLAGSVYLVAALRM